MLPKALEQIDYAALQALIGRARESKTLEFKREIPKGDKGKVKVLAGVTALANTLGGDFVIGVTERDGVADKVDGIAPELGCDGFKQWLNNILRDSVEPSLPRVDIHEVDCGDGRWAFVVRVQRSWLGPHRERVNNQFYLRTSTSSEPLDVADLRAAFGLREAGFERIEAFRRERLAKIMADDTPVPLAAGPKAVLHLAPLPMYASRDIIDVVNLVNNGSHMPMPFRGSGNSGGCNFNGICTIAGNGFSDANGYGQLFRSGAQEAVSVAGEHDGRRYWAAPEFAKCLVGAFRTGIALQRAYDFPFPTFAMLSLCNADELHFRIASHGGGFHDLLPRRQPVIAYPEIIIDDAAADVPALIKPLLDMVWNTYGELRCHLYDAAGNWTGG
jgi:hypothetical protein